jgi:hypothetical protein
MSLFGMIRLYDPLAVLAVTNQFHERAICLHAAQQALNPFFWKAVPHRGPGHLEPPQHAQKVYKRSAWGHKRFQLGGFQLGGIQCIPLEPNAFSSDERG